MSCDESFQRYDAAASMSGAVVLPDRPGPPERVRGSTDRAPGLSRSPSRGVVLVVEDDDGIRRMIDRHLTRSGFTVLTASTEQDAFAQASGADVAIVDLGLSEGDGVVLCDRLRDDVGTAALPVIVLTARDDLATKLRLFAAGVDDYITKPFEPLELIARIDATVRRSAHRTEWRRIGSLAISEEGDATLRGTTIPLTAAERELMSRLAAAFPGAASHESLRHGTWRRSDASSANVIEVIVARLRKKLASAGGGVEIRAVRGAGYVMRIASTDQRDQQDPGRRAQS